MAQCRLCLEEEEGSGQDPLIVPCRCSGSSQYIHRACLDSWRATRHNLTTFDVCEVCQFRYVIDEVPANQAQRKLQYRLQMAGDIVKAIFKLTSLVVLVAVILSACDQLLFTNRILHHYCNRSSSIKIWLCISSAVLLAGLGFVGFLRWICFTPEPPNHDFVAFGNDDEHAVDGWWRVRRDYRTYNHYYFSHNPCFHCSPPPQISRSSSSSSSSCDCFSQGCGGAGCRSGGSGGGGGGSGSGRDGCWVALVMCTALVILFSLFGIVIGLTKSILWLQQRAKFHAKHIWNTDEAKHKPVRDFSQDLDALQRIV